MQYDCNGASQQWIVCAVCYLGEQHTEHFLSLCSVAHFDVSNVGVITRRLVGGVVVGHWIRLCGRGRLLGVDFSHSLRLRLGVLSGRDGLSVRKEKSRLGEQSLQCACLPVQ